MEAKRQMISCLAVRKHKIPRLTKMIFQEEFDQLIRDCHALQSQLDNLLKDIANTTDQLACNVAGAETGIDEAYENALTLLKDRRDMLKGQIRNTAADRKQYLDTRKTEILLQQSRLQTAIQEVTAMVSRECVNDLALEHKLKSDLTELRDAKFEPVEKLQAELRFKPAEINHQTTHNLGTVSFKPRVEGSGIWRFDNSFGKEGKGKVEAGRGVAITQHGDVIVADVDLYDSSLKAFDKNGELKYSIALPRRPWNVAVSSNGKLFFTNQTPHVGVYDDNGHLNHQFCTKSPDGFPSTTQKTKHYGLAIDNQNRLLVGESIHRYISKHHLDGRYIESFKVTLAPWFIAVAPNNSIIVSEGGAGASVHILSEDGIHLHSLRSPLESSWDPVGLCCTPSNQVYVANWRSEGVVFCYSVDTGSYVGCVARDLNKPAGVALTDDGEKLVVADKNGMKVFKLQF